MHVSCNGPAVGCAGHCRWSVSSLVPISSAAVFNCGMPTAAFAGEFVLVRRSRGSAREINSAISPLAPRPFIGNPDMQLAHTVACPIKFHGVSGPRQIWNCNGLGGAATAQASYSWLHLQKRQLAFRYLKTGMAYPWRRGSPARDLLPNTPVPFS